ncbi:MAG TPA: hypothetical protein VJ596_06455 [Gemmatimonadaceae bacterium]|nr:hypothetical protein [Gemmatimonadaceae bacterium]
MPRKHPYARRGIGPVTPPADAGALQQNMSRRSALAAMAVATAGLAFGVSCKGSSSSQTAASGAVGPCLTGSDLGSTAGGEWVGNAKTKTLHHSVACAKHLPSSANSVAFGDDTRSFCIHRGGRMAGHEAVANRQIQSGDFEGAIASLRLAIAASPLSLHLYDKTIRLYGRLRQYDNIRSVLTEGMQFASQQQPRNPRESRQYDRARAELTLRLDRTTRRSGGTAPSSPSAPSTPGVRPLPPAPKLGT